jgi:glycerol-3-phosphate cytidylyltransferase
MKTAITFGVFDFYHLGHLRLLKQIRQRVGEPCYLIVAVQNGEYTLSQKPDSRMLYSTDERKEMLEANKYIDEVVVYDTVGDFIGKAQFDIFARAPEHTSPSIQKFEKWCVDNNKEIIITHRTEGISSSAIKSKIVADLLPSAKVDR